MKPFLILQLRPEREVSDDEFRAICTKGGLDFSDVWRIDLAKEDLPPDLDLADYSGTIVGGGPGCVSDPPQDKTPDEARIEAAILSLMPQITAQDLPFMGCCYGIGVLGKTLGAKVSKDRFGEPVGPVACQVAPEGRGDPVLNGLPDNLDAFVGHKEALQELPAGATHLIASAPCPFQMIRYKSNVYATQFHPEADADVFELRIRFYKDKGYFAPEDADRLIAACKAADVRFPQKILANFVARYRE